jgi:uncharacterized membrane protein YGL010W
MITMTHSLNTHSAQRKYSAATRIAFIVAFWIVAALLVAIAHQVMAAASSVISVAVETIAIVAVAGAYIRLVMPHATLDHALFAGTTWVLLGIAAEIVMTANSGRQWFALLGSPANGGLRCVLLIAWVIAPALFIRNRE